MTDKSRKCPECGGQLFMRSNVASGFGSLFLRGLGRIFQPPTFDVVICESCGLTRFYADPAAREKLRTSQKWQPVE